MTTEQQQEPEQTIHVESIAKDGIGKVFWSCKGHSGELSIAEARDQAMCLMLAGVMSRVEARVIENLLQCGEDSQQYLASVIGLVRQNREYLPEQLKPIYGYHTKVPLVDCTYYGEKITLKATDAMAQSAALLGASEGAQTDAYLTSSFNDVGLIGEIRERIMHSFREYRTATNYSGDYYPTES